MTEKEQSPCLNWTEKYTEEELKSESPRSAVLKASFVKKNDVFKGIVKIQTAAGPFFASAANSSLKKVSEKLTGQLRRRIQKWKT